jgi:hypothetical protein
MKDKTIDYILEPHGKLFRECEEASKYGAQWQLVSLY